MFCQFVTVCSGFIAMKFVWFCLKKEAFRNEGVSTDYSYNPCVHSKTLALNEGKMQSMSMVSNVDSLELLNVERNPKTYID